MASTWEQLMASADQAYLKGDVETAQEHWLQAVNAAEQAEDLKKAGMTLDRLAGALTEQKKYEDAGPVFEMAVEVKTGVYGANSMELIASLSGWVDSLQEQQKFDEALPVARRLLDAYKVVFGEEHPGAAAIATTMAAKYHEAEHPEAEEFYKQAIAIKIKTLGYKHADVVALTQKYAAYLKTMGRNDEAEAVLDTMVSSVSGVWKTVAAKMDKRGDKLTDGHLGKPRDNS